MSNAVISRPQARPTARVVRVRVLAACTLLLLGCILLSLLIGSSDIPLRTVWELLRAPDTSNDSFIVHGLRIPRTIIGICVGIALGVAGAVMQTLTRNPLADPGILGVTSGASLAIVIGTAAGAVTGIATQFAFAGIGALVATAIVMAIGTRGGASPVRLVLAGVAFSAACGGVIQAVLLTNPRAFDAFRYWDVGGLTRTDLPVWSFAVPIGVGLLLVFLMRRGLADISLGDDLAAALGTNVLLVRAGSLVALTLLTATATATAGPISFVGLMAPFIAGWLMGAARGWVIVASGLLGALLVLAADILGRVLARPAEMPVGLLTAFVGAPILLIIVFRLKGERA